MTKEKERKKEILDKVKNYYEEFHAKSEFKIEDKIAYAKKVYDSKEMTNLIDSGLEFWLTSGRYTKQFEEQLGKFLNVDYCYFVNSGSSANLLAFMALTSPLLKDRRIQRGDEVITVAAGFPTTIAPIVQYGAIPVFVDVTIPQYNIDIIQLEKAISEKTKAVMLAHTLGNPFNIKAVKELCNRHNLWLIEDNCDALGTMYQLDGEKRHAGTFGDIGTSSFYPPHHMTTGEGGAVYTDNPLLAKIMLSMRDWGRDCCCPSGQDNVCGHRFDGQYGHMPVGYDHKYVYSHLGYNLKATDMQAAVGCAQIEKLPRFVKKRKKNWKFLRHELAKLEEYLILPEKEPEADPSWFGFLITVKEHSPKSRNQIVRFLEGSGIQTRMLFAGNITRQPCFESLKEGEDYKVIGDLQITDKIMNDSFWIGVYPGMDEKMLVYMAAKLAACFSE